MLGIHFSTRTKALGYFQRNHCLTVAAQYCITSYNYAHHFRVKYSCFYLLCYLYIYVLMYGFIKLLMTIFVSQYSGPYF